MQGKIKQFQIVYAKMENMMMEQVVMIVIINAKNVQIIVLTVHPALIQLEIFQIRVNV